MRTSLDPHVGGEVVDVGAGADVEERRHGVEDVGGEELDAREAVAQVDHELRLGLLRKQGDAGVGERDVLELVRDVVGEEEDGVGEDDVGVGNDVRDGVFETHHHGAMVVVLDGGVQGEDVWNERTHPNVPGRVT